MIKIPKTLAIVVFTLFLFSQIKAQQVAIKPFSINQSNLIDDVKKLKISSPKITAEEFVKSSNSLLDKQGINFIVGLDANTCSKIEQIKKSQKSPDAPLNLRATLKSPLGEPAALLLPEANFSKNECLPCFVTLAFLEVTDKDFVTIVQDRNLKFFLPANFFVNEVFLVDEKDLTTVKSKWKIPFRTAPLSVSDDGNILFVGFDEPELADLTLAIFGEGTYQFYAKKDIDGTKKAVILKENQAKITAPNFAYIKFESAELKQTVKFPTRCPN
jgi:hypothetical protein